MWLLRTSHFKMIHKKCRNGLYPGSEVKRFKVPDNKVPWAVEYTEYDPVYHTATAAKNKPWADPEIDDPTFQPKWNSYDNGVNRKSLMGDYAVNDNNRPLNPIGRTGLGGRGLLGRWGPNHSADPIVTRWRRNETGALEIDHVTEKPILQFVAIQRQDSGEWAIPGGMVDPEENISTTLKREFFEEALNTLELNEEEKIKLENNLKEFFSKGDEVYSGMVDDPRNTDNSWIETIAVNFHDEDGSVVGKLNLNAGDDAVNVRWLDVNGKLNLYANHIELIKSTIHKRNAHW